MKNDNNKIFRFRNLAGPQNLNYNQLFSFFSPQIGEFYFDLSHLKMTYLLVRYTFKSKSYM